jgi:hypothetical protein
MKARWYLALAVGLAAVLLLLGWHGQTAQTRSWETNVEPTDKPAVNLVISFRDDGAPILKKVWLCAGEPRSGKVIKRAMDFSARSIGHDEVEFVLKGDPGKPLELTLPPSPGGSFKAVLKNKSSGSMEELQFDEVR